MADHVYKTTSINSFTRSVDGVLDENKHQKHTAQKKKLELCPLGTMQKNISHILLNAQRVYGTITLCRNLRTKR